MILIDTSVWIDHLRKPIAALADALSDAEIVVHPFVLGELLLGNVRNRCQLVEFMHDQVQAVIAEDIEVFGLIERASLGGSGIGYIDAHLVASVLIMPRTLLWARDRRLRSVAERLGIAADLD